MTESIGEAPMSLIGYEQTLGAPRRGVCARSEADLGNLSFGVPALHVCLLLESGPRALTPLMSCFDPKRTLEEIKFICS